MSYGLTEVEEVNAKAFDKLIAGEIFTSTEVQTNLEILCDDLGSRFAGTPAEAEAAQFLQATLQRYQLTDVRSEPFEYNGWTRGTAKLTVTSPWQRDLPCLSMPMSPSGKCTGKIIDLGLGSPETFETSQTELKGNIALVNIANPASAGRWVPRTEKYNRSTLAGAQAFIFVGNQDGYGPITGTLGFNRWGLIPGIMISKETGTLLQRAIRRSGSVEVEIETTDTLAKKTSWNIIGDVKGSAAADDMVLIGVHYDGHDISQGAEDPASGLVAGLEVARVLGIHADKLKRDVRFVLFGVEELGLIGAHAYVNTHPEDIAKTRFMFNLDSAGGGGGKGLMVYGQDSRAYFRGMGRQMDENLMVDFDASPLREPDHLSSDHYPFMAKGVACGFIRDPYSYTWPGFYHTAHDTVDKVDLLKVKEAAFLCTRLAWRVANDDDWHFKRMSEQELTDQKQTQDVREVQRIEKAVEMLRRQTQQ